MNDGENKSILHEVRRDLIALRGVMINFVPRRHRPTKRRTEDTVLLICAGRPGSTRIACTLFCDPYTTPIRWSKS